jgi:hypothetical protein
MYKIKYIFINIKNHQKKNILLHNHFYIKQELIKISLYYI